MCCTVGDDGMDWGQAEGKSKQLPPFVLYLVSENMAGVGEQRIVLWICVRSCRTASVRQRQWIRSPGWRWDETINH